MASSHTVAALKRLSVHFLGMGKTRLELASIELAQLRQATVLLVVWSVLAALVVVIASLFVAVVIVAHFWATHPYLALFGCAVFYLALGVWAILRVLKISRDESPLFEATLAELDKDRQAIVQTMKQPAERATEQGNGA